MGSQLGLSGFQKHFRLQSSTLLIRITMKLPFRTHCSVHRRIHQDAETACASVGVPQDQMTNCIYDIQAMDDVDAALNVSRV